MAKKKTIKKYLPLILVCSALLTVGLVLMFFSFYAVYKVYDIKLAINVSNYSAFNLDSDFINFGKGLPGNSHSRIIVLSHDYEKPLLIHFKSSGNITGFVALPIDFYLEPHLTKEVALNAVLPVGTQKGYYDGTLTVYFRRI